LLAHRAISDLCGWISSEKVTCFDANHPDTPLRSAFSDKQINASLDALIYRQNESGAWVTGYGYPSYVNPSIHWDGMYTIKALKTLKAYGRLEAF